MPFPEKNPIDSITDRRKVMGTLGLAGLGMLASSTSVDAFTSGASPKVSVLTKARAASAKFQQAVGTGGLPEQWVRSQGAALPEYNRYLTQLNLKAIDPKQVVEAHAKSKGSVWNTLPPKQWWNRMGYILRVADRIALEMNINQIEVISAYRSPVYNAHCEGAKSGSWHQANVAVDVKFPVRASKVTATARELRNLGLFRGGVGGYWNFTHLDARGKNTDW